MIVKSIECLKCGYFYWSWNEHIYCPGCGEELDKSLPLNKEDFKNKNILDIIDLRIKHRDLFTKTQKKE